MFALVGQHCRGSCARAATRRQGQQRRDEGMRKPIRTWLWRIALIALAGGAAVAAWWFLQPRGLPDGFAAGNGRIEAVEIDIAAKTAGRVREILVNEGDFVSAGQVLAKMDTAVLEAPLRAAEAQLRSEEHTSELQSLMRT